MLHIDKKTNCTGCHACAVSCPKNCIEMVADEEGFLYPRIDSTKCIDCGKCEKICSVLNKNTHENKSLQLGYAAYNMDETIRLNSSSGGIFTLLAKCIIHSGGIVVGAAMAEDCKSVRHIIVNSVDDLDKLRGSKYVQSTVGDTYKIVKQTLDAEKKVLFTGTPCQVGGLLSYLGKNYENLYTQDFICHGVPSPSVWKEYVNLREKAAGAVARRTLFRHKKYGWKGFSVLFEFSNDTEYLKDLHHDLFLRGFLANIYLRPSCYQCAFKTADRQSDITLSDFWGIQKIIPEWNDDKGISFVWIHSNKGNELFHSIIEQITFLPVKVSDALKSNSAALNSPSEPKQRKLFFDHLGRRSFASNIKKYSKQPIKKSIRVFLGKIKRKLLKH